MIADAVMLIVMIKEFDRSHFEDVVILEFGADVEYSLAFEILFSVKQMVGRMVVGEVERSAEPLKETLSNAMSRSEGRKMFDGCTYNFSVYHATVKR